MPFCPNCRTEYIPGIRQCADCGDALVDQLPEEDQGEAFQLVRLHSFPGEVYANMVGEALEHKGIPYLVQKDVLGSTVIVQGGSETLAALQPGTTGAVTRLWTRAGIGGFTGATQFQGQHEFKSRHDPCRDRK